MLYEYMNCGASNWSRYFAVLPTEFDTLMFWSEDELAELQASAVVNKIGKEAADAAFLEQLLPVIREFANVFFAGEEYAREKAEHFQEWYNLLLMHKMGSLIMAYAFDVDSATPRKDIDDEGFAEEDEDEALPKGMIPLADMLNADADRNNAQLFYEDKHLDMKALKPIRAGEEIFNDYGTLPRSDLLRRYGYITDNYAQYDVVEIPMDLIIDTITAADLNSEERLEYLVENEIIDTGYDVVVSTPFTLQESLSPELIILIETLLLPNDEFERLKRKGKLPKSDRITSKGAELLYELVQTRIAQYPTTLDEDMQAATARPQSGSSESKIHRASMARAVRMGEKQILKQTEQALAELVSRDRAASKRQRDVDEEGDVEMCGVEKKQRA